MLSKQFATIYKADLLIKREWKGANTCRLFLQVLSISDITTGNGCCITQLSWDGIRCHETARDIEWPHQGNPDSTDWVSWRKALTLSLCTGEDLRLSIPLGFWSASSTALLPNWIWFWDHEGK